MRVVLDIEANGLIDPTEIWCIVCKDIDTGEVFRFGDVTKDPIAFINFSNAIDGVIGHNIIGYDLKHINRLLGHRGLNPRWKVHSFSQDKDHLGVVDTFIVSKLVEYSRQGHSLEAYGIEFQFEKGKNYYPDFFGKWSQELEDYCVRDVEISHKVYLKYLDIVNDPQWTESLSDEHAFQRRVVNDLTHNGFYFNTDSAHRLLDKVILDLLKIDKEFEYAFPAKLKLIREVTPRYTKYGSLSRTDFRWVASGDLSDYNGGPFSRCKWEEFNPSSHKQIISVLTQAGWKPTDKTKTHVETEREYNRAKYTKEALREVDLETLHGKLLELQKTGWKINEENLNTLPSSAPAPARLLAKRILLESRRRTLTEWLGLVREDHRIHGEFQGIGAWTHRMAHQKPNTANIPNEFNLDGTKKLLGKELRALWQAPRNRLLVGVDAEGIQLRIFAHYVNDTELTQSLVNGNKTDKTDPHSLNQRVLGSICKSRAAAKRFLYALLLGGGVGKLSEILECSKEEAMQAVDLFQQRYPGFAELKRDRFPSDAKRGFFIGLDGRRVHIPGVTDGDRRHLCMSGYLQNGEAIVMKKATLKWIDKLHEDKAILVNFVHDEWQTEAPNNMETALKIAKMQAESLHLVGQELKLNCPLAGSYWNEDKRDYTIGTNWSVTH